MTAEELIRREYGRSFNFLTPNIIEYGWIIEGSVAYEISSGMGLDFIYTVGVSLARLNADGTTERLNKLSAMVSSRYAADKFIEGVRAELEKEGHHEHG